MSYVTYILISISYNKTYVGHTDNIKRRLEEHNRGKNIFSNRYKPWRILHAETFSTLKDAVKKERYLKSAAGRRWMKKNLFNN